MNKIFHKINNIYCFAHILILKLVESSKTFENKETTIKRLFPKDVNIILDLLATRKEEDEYKCPMSSWDEKKILRAFKYSIFFGMYKEDDLISVVRIYMHHWNTVETTTYVRPDYRNNTSAWFFFFYIARILNNLYIKTLHITVMEATTAITRLTRYDIVRKLPSPEGKIIMEIDINKLCAHPFNPLKRIVPN